MRLSCYTISIMTKNLFYGILYKTNIKIVLYFSLPFHILRQKERIIGGSSNGIHSKYS